MHVCTLVADSTAADDDDDDEAARNEGTSRREICLIDANSSHRKTWHMKLDDMPTFVTYAQHLRTENIRKNTFSFQLLNKFMNNSFTVNCE